MFPSEFVTLKAYGIGEETNAGNNNGPDVVPAKRRFVNFGKSKATAFIDIMNMEKVIVKIVVGIVPAGRFGGRL